VHVLLLLPDEFCEARPALPRCTLDPANYSSNFRRDATRGTLRLAALKVEGDSRKRRGWLKNANRIKVSDFRAHGRSHGRDPHDQLPAPAFFTGRSPHLYQWEV